MSNISDSIFTLMGKIGVDNSQALKGIDEVTSKASSADGKTGKSFSGMASKAKVAFLGIAGAVVGAGAALGALAKKTADYGDNVHKASQKMGISNKAYQEMDYILGQNGASIDVMQRGFKTLVERQAEAAEGAGKGAEAFNILGLSAKDTNGELKTQEQMFEESAKALMGMPEGAEKSKLAFDMFGKAGQELMPLLNGTAEDMDTLKQQAHDMGIVMSDESVQAAADLTDMMDNAKRSVGAIGTQIGAKLMPILLTMLTWVVDHMPQIQAVIGVVVDTVINVINTLVDVFKTYLMPVFQALFDWVEQHMPEIQSFIGTTFDAVKAIFKGFVDIVSKLWDTWGDYIMSWVGTVFSNIKTVIETVMGVIQGIIKVVTGIIQGDWSLVWEGIKQVFSTIWEGIKTLAGNFLEFLRNIFDTMMTKIKENTIDKFTEMKDGVVERVTAMIDFVKEMPGKMAEGVRKGAKALQDQFKAMWNGVVNVIKRPVNAVIGGANWILDKFGTDKLDLWDPVGYAKGTDGHLGGPALINDQSGSVYREAVQLPDGHTFVPKGRNLLFPNMPKGTKVLPAYDTQRVMKYEEGVGIWEQLKEGAGNIWSFLSNPLDLVSNVIKDFVNYDGMVAAPLNMAKGLVGKAKTAMFEYVKGLFTKYQEMSMGGGVGFGGWPITSPFGWRIHPITGDRRFHSGVDFGAPYGAAVAAQHGGVVNHSGWMGGYGIVVKIAQGIMEHMYAHLSNTAVGVGQSVTAGQTIGYIGSTGNSTGPHLHYEVRRNGSPVDPGFADGTMNARAGWAWVGERGPELMKFNGGEQVLDAETSKEFAGAKQPLIVQLVMEDGRILAENIVDDINALLRGRYNLDARGLA